MKISKDIRKSLVFRINIPLFLVFVIFAAGIYLFVMSIIKDFSLYEIEKDLHDITEEIYLICDRNLDKLVSRGVYGDEKHMRITKAYTLGEIEDMVRERDVHAVILDGLFPVLKSSRDLSDHLLNKIGGINPETVVKIETDRDVYYGYRIDFEPWNWKIIILESEERFRPLFIKIQNIYIIFFILFACAVVLLSIMVYRFINRPVNSIVEKLKRAESPDYRGIAEFEFLSDEFKRLFESVRKEKELIETLYSISLTKRGGEFYDDVVTLISIIFKMDSLIAKILPDGNTLHVLSMYTGGEIKKDFGLSIKRTPCEGVVQKKHMHIEEREAWKRFPDAEFLQKTKAESYIGFPVMDREGNVRGVINAFGKERRFDDIDIKFFRTVGEIIASEFEFQERIEAERILREELYQSQKMEAIGRLAGGVAHDFNNALQVILGYLSIIKERIKDEDIIRQLNIIETSAERASQLTRQLLGFARKGRYVMEPVNLNHIVENLYKIIRNSFDRIIEINTVLEPNLWITEADPSQIEHALLNLCLNARDSMPHGGVLTIETSNAEIEVEPLSEKKRYVVVRVRDTGTGMDEETRKRIFEPFFTTKPDGTGMGLAMVYGVIKNHKGIIDVDTEVGRGTTFTIAFPAVEKEYREERRVEDESHRGEGTVLVVDDEEFVRNLLGDILITSGYNVIKASDGREAIDIYLKNKDKINLVILDMIMPKMNGRDTFIELRKINPALKIVIATGYAEDNVINEMRNLGVDGFLEKPFTPSGLARVLKSLG